MDPFFYEVIPPPLSWSQKKALEWTDAICQMLKRENITTINLPEVVNENREKKRTIPFAKKMDNLDYAQLLALHYPHIHTIPNKISVHLPKRAFLEWVDRAYAMGKRHLILVGGEHSGSNYPGPSVLEAARLIKERYPTMTLGGVTIFTRKQESHRILRKMEHGIDFFVSQIIFETANMKCVLLHLKKLCLQARIRMPRIYLSLALPSKTSDIRFMEWLGVEFPTAILSFFLDAKEETVTSRALEVIHFLLEEMTFFLAKTGLDIGFNVEQVIYGNQKEGEQLLKMVKKCR